MSTDFINCGSLFSRLVTKLASAGQRQQFCQLSLPPVQCLCISGTQAETGYKQKRISTKMGNISLYEYGQTKRSGETFESLFLNLLNKPLTSLPYKKRSMSLFKH